MAASTACHMACSDSTTNSTLATTTSSTTPARIPTYLEPSNDASTLRTPSRGFSATLSVSHRPCGSHDSAEVIHRFMWARRNDVRSGDSYAASSASHDTVRPNAGFAHGHHFRSVGSIPGGGDHSAKYRRPRRPVSIAVIAASRNCNISVDDWSPAVDHMANMGFGRAIMDGLSAS